MAKDYDAESIEFMEPTILLSIGKALQDGRSIYDAARFAWRVDLERVQRYKLALAHAAGIVVGAFRPTQWLPATNKNFPGKELRISPKDDRINCMPGRYGFVGKPAEDVWDLYVNKRVPGDFLGGQAPVRYCESDRS